MARVRARPALATGLAEQRCRTEAGQRRTYGRTCGRGRPPRGTPALLLLKRPAF